MRLLGQALSFMAFMAVIVFLSAQPRLRVLPEDTAVISVSVSHAGRRLVECRMLTQEELNDLPPNMRKVDDCPRERYTVRIELSADGAPLYRESLPPSGLWSDGKSVAYRRIRIKAGTYAIRVGMRDGGDETAFDYSAFRVLTLRPGQNLVIGFDGRDKEFRFL